MMRVTRVLVPIVSLLGVGLAAAQPPATPPAPRTVSWSRGRKYDPIKKKRKPTNKIGPTESIATVRLVSPTGVAPTEVKKRPIGEAITAGSPNSSEIQPRRIGELMSPNT